MRIYIQKFIIKPVVWILIVSLFFQRLITVQVLAEGDSAPTSVPKEEAPASEPAPSSAPSDSSPTSPPQQPSEQPAPTSVPSTPQATTAPQPTSSSNSNESNNTDGTKTGQTTKHGANSPPPPEGWNSGNITGATPTQGASGITGASGVYGTTGDSSSQSEMGTYGASGSINDPANTVTGPFSSNNANESNESTTSSSSQNTGSLSNDFTVNSDTGFNYANLNTLPGEITTGNAQAVTNLLNKLNSTITGTGGFTVSNIYGQQIGDIVFSMVGGSLNNSFASASGQVTKNAVTGPGSDNTASASDVVKVKEANGNDAKIENDIVLKANTGGNEASYNTLGGSIKTGNAAALANIINLANTNLHVDEWLFGIVNIFGSLYGNIILPPDTAGAPSSNIATATQNQNSETGPLSSNNAESTNNDNKTITNTNSADVESTVKIGANTGNNDASANTAGGSIQTGNSDANVVNTTVANTNVVNEDGTVWLVIVNELGKWVGHIIGAPWETNVASNNLPVASTSSGNPTQNYNVDTTNGATGPLSSNDASYSNSKSQDFSNSNSASIVNNITVDADTGNNKASVNTGPGAIKTGNANAGVNLLNMVNTNITAKKFVVLLVNVFGTFFGDIVPPDQKAERTIPAPTTTTSDASPSPAVGGTTAQNTEEPAPSEVDPATMQSEETVVPQETAYVDNTVVATTMVSQNTIYTDGYSYIPSQQRVIRKPAKTAVLGTQTLVAGKKYSRGIFISPAFIKAGKTSLTELFFGSESMQVDYAWLWVMPAAMGFILWRRRSRIDWNRYVNTLFDIVL